MIALRLVDTNHSKRFTNGWLRQVTLLLMEPNFCNNRANDEK